MTEVVISGVVGHLGEVLEFPKNHGHFASVLAGAKPENLFAMAVGNDIPQANILAGDLIIFDQAKIPQPGDTCIAPIGERLFLIYIGGKTFDARTPALVMSQKYQIPEALSPHRRQYLHWYPLAYDEDNHNYFLQIAEEQQMPISPYAPELILATALRLVRTLAF